MNKTFSKGEVIFREGDNGESFFEVIKGKRIYGLRHRN